MTNRISRISVTVVFSVIYAAFLLEVTTLFIEFQPHGLGFRFAGLFAHNFLFFPVVGLLALTAFWRPTVLLLDALLHDKVKYGRVVLTVSLALVIGLSAMMANAFAGSNVRSLFEIAPAAIAADEPAEVGDPAQRRASLTEILIKLKVNARDEGGLTDYAINCDPEWLRFAVNATESEICFPTGTEIPVADCCAARTRFIRFVNTLQAEQPSALASVHRFVTPIKMFFLFLLLAVGVLLVQLRTQLTALYGRAMQEVTFPLAVGGSLMLLWPLMNASYLETLALLTADGGEHLYRMTAPLFALGFGIWVMLLIFFHLRTYPSQMEMALKAVGVLIAALGVTQYEQIITYLTQTLGVGGGMVAVLVFVTLIATLAASIALGIKPPEVFDPRPKEEDSKET